jgi:hypothetical protein
MATDKSASLAYETADDFTESYANNVYFESSAWDMKLIFGQLDQRGKVKIVQHTAITLPWTQIKLLIPWLKGHLEAHELVHGKVRITANLIPPELLPPSKELKESDPNAEAIYDVFNKIRNEFVASLKQG